MPGDAKWKGMLVAWRRGEKLTPMHAGTKRRSARAAECDAMVMQVVAGMVMKGWGMPGAWTNGRLVIQMLAGMMGSGMLVAWRGRLMIQRLAGTMG
jgi:hypothetical protein